MYSENVTEISLSKLVNKFFPSGRKESKLTSGFQSCCWEGGDIICEAVVFNGCWQRY